MTTTLEVSPLPAPPDATVAVPGSRSITNRALVCAGLAEGRSRLHGALAADDTEAMTACLTTLGAVVVPDPAEPTTWDVAGTGGRLAPGPAELHSRLSGTTSRFVLPLLALGEGRYRLDAAGPMRRRPMADLLDALAQLGVTVDAAGAHLPVTVDARGLDGGHVRVAGDVSSQFLSGLLLAGPLTREGLTVEVTTDLRSRPYVEMTAAVMTAFGAEVTGDGGIWQVAPGGYRAADYPIEPDASTAAYFLAAAAVTGGRVRVPGLGRHSLQGDARFVDVLGAMGCEVRWHHDGVEVEGGRTLRGVEVDLGDLSDQAPTLAVVAAFAETPTRVRGVGFIRAKESDRIAGVVAGLAALGVAAEPEPDGFVVRPGASPHGGRIETRDDHRMAMSFALAGLAVAGVEIVDPECVGKTFPGFWQALERLRPSSAAGGR